MRNEPSRTAEAVCLFRATDQRRIPEERIVDDPLANLFLGPMARAMLATIEATGRLGRLAERYAPGLITYVLCRHRFIDDCLVRVLRGSVAQVVLLGAGYDTRAYRFADLLDGRTVYEVDLPATIRRKARILERHRAEFPASHVQRVEIDFLRQSIDEVLFAAGFKRNAPTFFVWEGVTMYLTRAAVKEALSRMRQISAAGSTVAMDYWYLIDSPDLASTAYRVSASALHLLGEPVVFSLHPEEAGPFLERQGFEIVDLADGEELQRRYVSDGRQVYPGNYLVEARSR